MQLGHREYIYAQLANDVLYKWVMEFFVMGNGLISVKLWLKDYGVNGHGTRFKWRGKLQDLKIKYTAPELYNSDEKARQR